MAFEKWNGFSLERIELSGKEAIIVYPHEGTENGKWALKTEYFKAFPDTQIKLLEQGWHIAHIRNETRWYTEQDNENRAKLAEFMHNELGLSKKCAIIGMSCGGMQGIYFGAKHPELVSCMYLDAPVVNFLSTPAGMGIKGKKADEEDELYTEFYNAKKITKIELLSYREHPLDYIPRLIENKIPIILVSGDSDSVVSFEENGRLLQEAYERAGAVIETHIKPGGDHHPHGLPDNSPIVDFIVRHSEE